MVGWFRHHTTFGFRRAVRALADETRAMHRHKRGVRRARTLHLPEGARLQLGCGSQPKSGWINIDLYASAADLALDVREDLPFPDNSIAFVYTEHLLEHIGYPTDATHLLREVKRVLRPGGGFSIVIPDFGDLLHAYAQRRLSFFDDVPMHMNQGSPTPMHHVNYWFRQDGHHRYAYDEETLGQVLREAGFDAVRARSFDPSIDSEKRHLLHSLYMEAIKPLARRAFAEETPSQTPGVGAHAHVR
jgi:predicted SAM-dependent methyltransferase